MKKYRVHSEFNCSDEFETLEQAQAIFEQYRDELMSEGVSENDSYVEIAESEDDFGNYKVIKKVVAVRDHERMAVSTPEEEGFTWVFWAKWQEVSA